MPPLTEHFTLEELHGDDAPQFIQSNLLFTANHLEPFRDILGVPIHVTSGYRTPEHNAEIGGSPTSDHVQGLAVDGYHEGVSMYEAWKAYSLVTLPDFDQIEWDLTNQHIHWGFGYRMRRRQFVKNLAGDYVPVTLDLVRQFAGAPKSSEDPNA